MNENLIYEIYDILQSRIIPVRNYLIDIILLRFRKINFIWSKIIVISLEQNISEMFSSDNLFKIQRWKKLRLDIFPCTS